MDNLQLRLEYRPTLAELCKFALQRMFRTILLTVIWCLVLGQFSASVLLRLHHNGMFSVPSLIVAVFYFLVWTAGSAVLAILGTVRYAGHDHAVVLEPDGVTYFNSDAREFFGWKSIRKIPVNSGDIRISTKSLAGFTIPSKAFRDSTDHDRFLHAMLNLQEGNAMVEGAPGVWPPPPV